jgi:hypothetical protein
MVTRRRLLTALVAWAALAGDRAAARPLEPLEVDGEQMFRLTWEVGERGGRPVILGRIDNVSVYGTSRIQLLVDRLDAGGRIVAQQLAWVGVDIRSGGHAFFDVPVPDRAATYRVRVYAFNRKFGTGI